MTSVPRYTSQAASTHKLRKDSYRNLPVSACACEGTIYTLMSQEESQSLGVLTHRLTGETSTCQTQQYHLIPEPPDGERQVIENKVSNRKQDVLATSENRSPTNAYIGYHNTLKKENLDLKSHFKMRQP